MKTTVGGQRLRDLRRLKEVIIPEGVQKVGEQWFMNSEIEGVEIPANVEIIEDEAFCNCEKLKRVTFAPGSRLKKIGTGCFQNTGVEKTVIPKGVTEIQGRTFSGCKNLREVVFETGSELKTIRKSMSEECTNLATTNLPEGLQSIGDRAFRNCRSLTSIQFPDGLKDIGENCFENSGLKEVVLPASVREVDASAF